MWNDSDTSAALCNADHIGTAPWAGRQPVGTAIHAENGELSVVCSSYHNSYHLYPYLSLSSIVLTAHGNAQTRLGLPASDASKPGMSARATTSAYACSLSSLLPNPTDPNALYEYLLQTSPPITVVATTRNTQATTTREPKHNGTFGPRQR